MVLHKLKPGQTIKQIVKQKKVEDVPQRRFYRRPLTSVSIILIKAQPRVEKRVPVSICTYKICTKLPLAWCNSWWQTERQPGSPGALGHQRSLAWGLTSGQRGSKVRRGYPTTSVLSVLPEKERSGREARRGEDRRGGVRDCMWMIAGNRLKTCSLHTTAKRLKDQPKQVRAFQLKCRALTSLILTFI